RRASSRRLALLLLADPDGGRRRGLFVPFPLHLDRALREQGGQGADRRQRRRGQRSHDADRHRKLHDGARALLDDDAPHVPLVQDLLDAPQQVVALDLEALPGLPHLVPPRGPVTHEPRGKLRERAGNVQGWPPPLAVKAGRGSFQRPRVKSGNATALLPALIESSDNGAGALQAAASYTSMSGTRPSRTHCMSRQLIT